MGEVAGGGQRLALKLALKLALEVVGGYTGSRFGYRV